jgi:hypothetical protein
MYIVTSVGGEGDAIGASGKAGNYPFAKRKLFQLATLRHSSPDSSPHTQSQSKRLHVDPESI